MPTGSAGHGVPGDLGIYPGAVWRDDSGKTSTYASSVLNPVGVLKPGKIFFRSGIERSNLVASEGWKGSIKKSPPLGRSGDAQR